MNKTDIEWADLTWNPVTGCLHWLLGLCKIPCYAIAIAKRFARLKINPFYDRLLDLNLLEDDLTKQEKSFKPTFHIERLLEVDRVMEPRTIFVCSMADLFGSWVPWEWQKAVFDAVMGAPWHTYIFLTKNPEGMFEAQKRYYYFVLKEADEKDTFSAITWWGTTVNFKEDIHRIEMLQDMWSKNLFISFEPLLQNLGELDLTGIKQVIIGAQTGPFLMPSAEALADVVYAAEQAGAKVFFKDNMVIGLPKDIIPMRDLCWSVRK